MPDPNNLLDRSRPLYRIVKQAFPENHVILTVVGNNPQQATATGSSLDHDELTRILGEIYSRRLEQPFRPPEQRELTALERAALLYLCAFEDVAYEHLAGREEAEAQADAIKQAMVELLQAGAAARGRKAPEAGR